MKKWILPLLFAAVLFGRADASALPGQLTIDDAGNLQIDNTRLGWILYPPGWNAILLDRHQFHAAPGFPKRGEGRFETAGTWAGFHLATTISSTGPGTVNYRAAFRASPPVNVAMLALVTEFPIGDSRNLEVNGKPFRLPAKFRNIQLYGASAKSLAFDCGGKRVTLSGKFRLLIQDDRKWRINRFLIRISPEPFSGLLSETALDLKIRIDAPEVTAIDLRNAVNMGFRDEVANDGKGGWTDQGPKNDLRMFPPGTLSALGVAFDIIDPEKNKGKSCLVLSGGRSRLPTMAEIPVAGIKNAPWYLYVLHSTAWTPSSRKKAGEIVVEFTDGSTQTLPVVTGLDVGNWWAPYACPNAAVAWVGENAQSVVGLYLSQFRLEKTPRKLTFRAAPEGDLVWIVTAASLGNRQLNLQKIETPSYIVEDKDWLPLEFSGEIVKDSVLDFSRYTDAPAGKYGPVEIDGDGHFVFRDAPEKRIRFFGPNLVGGCHYVSREALDRFVTQVSRLGYNAVRFHHFEGGLIDYAASDSLTLRPARLDSLNYLFAELKKRGIYITIDLYASRPLRDGDNIEERKGRHFNQYDFEMKNLLPVSESTMNNWKEFARRLLTQRNPYTGLTWAEDPALSLVNLVNENPLVAIWNRVPQLIPLYEKRYVEFLQRNHLDTPENRSSRGGLFIEFLSELQIECIREQSRFLREELKIQARITDLNMVSKYTLTAPRSHLECVDNHRYWDHPTFPVTAWELPYQFSTLSSIAQKAESPRYLMPARIFGKPYTVTEFNFCNPNPFRQEGSPLIGAYAGLQDWDGLYRFAWSHYGEKMLGNGVPVGFDIINDPQAQLGERIIQMLFVRGDVAAAKQAYAFTATPEEIRALAGPPGACGDYPDEFSELGLYARVGSLMPGVKFPCVQSLYALQPGWRKKLPAAARNALETFDHSGRIASENGQIMLDTRKKSIHVVTPRSEVATFAGESRGKGVMTLSNANRYQTVALLSLDDKALADSSSLLLVQLPNVAATKQKFANRQRKLLESWGELPLLVERTGVEVELKLPGQWKVEALKLDGTPNGTIASENRNGVLCFQANTAARSGGVMAYHLTREP